MILNKVVNNLKKQTFSRANILFTAQNMDSCFKNTQLRYLIGALLKNNKITRVGRNMYIKNYQNKIDYINLYSSVSQQLICFMNKKFPSIDYRIWELSLLNEFFRHQISENQIFLEVEKDVCDFVYSEMPETLKKKCLLKPTVKEFLLYGNEKKIVIDKLTTESPKGQQKFFNVCLEKLIVDLFSNKILKAILPVGDYPAAISEIFNKYNINHTKMLRYARRKNKEEELCCFFETKTDIKIFKEIRE